MPFDVQGARRAGYSDAEIADYLSREAKFNAAGARKSGYTDREIIDHIEGTRARDSKTLGEQVSDTIGGIGSAISGAYDRAGKAVRSGIKSATGYDIEAANARSQAQHNAWAARDIAAKQQDVATQDGLIDRVGDFFTRGELGMDAGVRRVMGATGDQNALRLARAGEQAAQTKIGGEVTWEEVKGNWLNAPQFMFEKGIESLPFMASAATAPGAIAAGVSNTGQIGQSRAEADGRTDATGTDVGIAAPFGIASALLDVKGLDSIVKATGRNAATRIAKAAAAEGGTEAAQSAIEYTGGAAGTQKGWSAGEMLDQAVQGGLVGAGMGGAIRGAQEGGAKTFRLAGDALTRRPIAPGIRTQAATVASQPTEEDIASPIPTDIIMQGKAATADAVAAESADSILRSAGMPKTGTRVTITMPDGSTQTGTMADAFMTDAGEMGTAAGLAIRLDNGTTFTEHFDTIAEAGVKISPATSGALAEADAIDAELAAQAAAGVPSTGTEIIGAGSGQPARQRGKGGLDPRIVDGLVKRGLTPEQAQGVAAGIHAESASNPGARNPTSGAMGLGQWLGPRKAAIVKQYGENPTLDQQLDFLVGELRGGDAGGKFVLAENDPAKVLNAYVTKFMRPAKGAETEGDLARGAAALGMGTSGTTAAADPIPARDGEAQDSTLPDLPEVAPLRSAAREDDWRRFPEETETLGIPRAEMPQVKAEDRGAMVNFLNARGIAHQEEEVPAASLKPSQAEFSPSKVQQAAEFKGGNRAVLVSSDGYVLDGHHQALAAAQAGENVRIIRLNAPIRELVQKVREFPSSTLADGATSAADGPIMDRNARSEFVSNLLTYKGVATEGDILVGPGVRLNYQTASYPELKAAADKIVASVGAQAAQVTTPQPQESAAPASQARTEPTESGKGVAIIGATEAELAAVAAAIPNATPLPPRASDGGVVYSKKYEAKIKAALAASNTAGPQDGGAASPIEAPEGARPDARPADGAGSAAGAVTMSRDEIIARRAALLERAPLETDGRFADMVTGKDFWGLNEILLPHNKKSRRVFSEVTGVKLPDTKAGTEEALRKWAGISQEEVARVRAERDDKRAAERADRERDNVRRDAESVQVRLPDGSLKSGREWVDDRIEEGFDRLVNTSSGAVPKWALANAEGRGYPIKKELLAYARSALERVTPREMTDQEIADLEGIPLEDVIASKDLFRTPEEREAANGTREPAAPSKSASPKATAESKFMAVWNDPEFKRAMKAIGDLPHRESPVGADMVSGWINGKAGDLYALSTFYDRLARVIEDDKSRRARTYQEFGFNPRQSYMESFYAAVGLEPTQIRAIGNSTSFINAAEAYANIQAKIGEKSDQPVPPAAEPVPEADTEVQPTPDALENEVLALTSDQYEQYLRALNPPRNPNRNAITSRAAQIQRQFTAMGESAMRAALAVATGRTPNVAQRGDRVEFPVPGQGMKQGKVARVRATPEGRTVYDIDVDGGGLQNAFADEARVVPAAEPSGNGQIGTNDKGLPLYEDENGVRSYVERGIRITEPVGMVPTRDRGIVMSVDVSARRGEFLTDQEREARNPATPAPKPAAPSNVDQEPAAAKPADWGANNKGVTREEAEELRAELRSLMFGKLNSGIDPKIAAVGMRLAAFHIEAGARRVAELAKAIADDLGTTVHKIQPYIEGWYLGARGMMRGQGLDITGMDDAPAVEAFADALKMTAPAEPAISPPETSDDARTAVYPQGAGPLEEVAADDVPDAAAGRDAGSAGAASQPGSRGTSRAADGERNAASRGGGNGAARPDNAAPRKGRRLGEPGTKAEAEPRSQAEEAQQDPNGAIEHASPNNVPAVDFTITDDVELGKGGASAKFQDNLAAIQTLKKIESENRRASPAEQRILARYVGWGGLKNAFRVAGATDGSGIAKGWESRVAELEALLTPAELRAARNSTTAAHFTSQTVVQAMWKAVEQMGFTGGAVLEPSVGTGNFLGLMPKGLRGPSKVFGVEYDSLTARMAQMLYPNAAIVHSGFQAIPIPRNQFALAIGNPPFGRESLHFPYRPEVNGKSIHNQFFLASLDSVAPGGLMAMVVSHNLMDALDPSARYALAEKGEFLGGIRLPDTAFKENAGTEVVTDMLFFRRRSESEAAEAKRAIDELKGAKPDPNQPRVSARLMGEIDGWTRSTTIADPAGSGEQINANDYFMLRPHMVIGSINATGTMNARADLNVTLDNPAEFESRLAKAVERLPKNVIADSLAERTVTHFAVMAKAMELAARRAEIGSVRIDTDGKLKMVVDFDAGEAGKSMMQEIAISENTPFADDYTLTRDGKWQRTIDKLDAAGKPVKVMKGDRATNRNVKETITYERESDIPARDRWGSDRIAMLRAMLPIRDAMKKQLALETQDATDGMIELNRKLLNKAYDAFVAKHGNLHSQKPLKIATMMPDGGLILAAEVAKGKSFTKADIMQRRVAAPPKLAERAEDVSEAIALNLSETGRIDLARVGQLLGTDEAGAAKALAEGEEPAAFYDPELGRWEPRDLYLSGLVRRKLLAAQAEGLTANVKALEAVVPEDWGADQITPVIGSAWIPPQVYADFMRHLGYSNAAVTYSSVTNSFSVTTVGQPAPQWDTSGNAHSPDAIVSRLLNSQPQKVTFIGEDKKTVVDEVATAESEAKASEIYNEFLDWAFSDEARRTDLVRIFNEKFNTRLIRQRDGSHLKLYGKVPDTVIKMRRHQMNAIWRGITDPAVLYDHVVGAGKTFTAIARIMERRRMGLSRKPMVVVPNHLVEQWVNDAKLLYPGANVLGATKKDFERANRRRLFARIGSSDFDMVIIGHSSFGFVDLDPATEDRYISEELAAAQKAVKEAAEEAAATGIGNGRKPFTVAEAERLVKKLEARLDRLRTSKRDRLLTFEEMGIDDLTVDEAHEFKNLSYSSRLQNVSGMGNKTGSQKAMDLHLKVRSLRERPGTSVAFLTGTPISNSVAEMYLLLRNLVPHEMKEMGIENFDAWRAMFVSYATEWEPTEAGSVKEVARLGRQWSNMRTLMDLYYSVADAVTIEDIVKAFAEDNPGRKFPIPDVASRERGDGDRERVIVLPTPEQNKILAQVVSDFAALPQISDAKERGAERLRLMDRARKVSLDARAVDPNLQVTGRDGKIPAVVDRVYQTYRKWDEDKGTQIIFLDRSVPKAKGDDKIIADYDAAREQLAQAIRDGDEKAEAAALDALDKFNANEVEELRIAAAGGWNAYDEIKRQLVAKGIPENEIRFVQEANTDIQKKALFDLVKSGQVRVLIGSTPRMGAGTNVQDRLVALHHVDVTWKPSDIEQREGRIVRQGNKLLEKYGDDFKVDVIAYVTERTIDAKMWNLNAGKLKAINGIRKYDGSFDMEFEDEESASMAEMAALATGNPLMIERVTLDGDIKKLELQQRSFNNRVNGMRDRIRNNKSTLENGPGRIKLWNAFADDIEGKIAAARDEAAKRSITIEGKSYGDRDAAAAAADAAIAEARGGDPKARFAIVVDGEKLTTQDQIAEALRAAFGTPGFVGSMGGKKVNSYNDLAKALTNAAAAQPKSEFTLDGITINGVPVEVDVLNARYSAGKKEITLSFLDADGKQMAGYSSQGDGLSVSLGRALIEKAVNGLSPEQFRANARVQERSIERARDELPSLQAEVDKPWPKAIELQEKRDRLKDVIAQLAATDDRARFADANPEQAEQDRARLMEDAEAFDGIAEPGREGYDGGNEQAPAPADARANDGGAVPAGQPGSGAVQAGRDERDRGVRSDRVPVVRGLGIAERFERTGATALVGETVASGRDLAEMAQVYRDPRHETLRVFFTNGDTIVHATAVSTRSASASPLLPGKGSVDQFIRWLGETMRATGADGYYMLHNHPSGLPEPSREDRVVTRAAAAGAPGFRAHVIINSNKFGLVDWMGNGEVLDLPTKPDRLLTPSKPHPILGEKVQGSTLARLAKDVQLAQGDYVTLILANAKQMVRAVVDVPRAMLARPDVILFGALRRQLRQSGSEFVYLVGTNEDLSSPAVRKALRAGVLTAAINENGFGTKGGTDYLPDFLLGGNANAVAEDREAFDGGPEFTDSETERRFQDAKAGLATPQTWLERAKEYAETFRDGMTRHWIALPNVPRYAALQEKLRAIEAAPQSARERTIRMLDDLVKDFTAEDLDLFTRKVILDDLAWDAANDRDLPFGFNAETLMVEKARIDQLVAAQPDQRVFRAAMKRKLANRRIAEELVRAGVLEADQIRNPAYYRHQVLEYARAQAAYAKTPGKKLRTPKWAKRMGSSLDINANLLEAEFDWLNKAFVDIPVAQTIEWIKKSEHNILADLKKQAKDSNDSGVAGYIAQAKEVLEDERSSDTERMKAQLLIDQEKGFRQYIAMGFEHVRTALENGEIDVPARFRRAAEGIEGGRGSVGDPPFDFLAWMLDTEAPGAMGAAMILKAISQRRVWTKALLGRSYIDPMNADELVKRLAPEGYRTWQPDEGKLLFTVKTIPEHVIDALIEKIDSAEGVDPTALRGALEGARSALAMGGSRYTMILPEEVADTLNNLRRDELGNLFDHLVKEPVRLWKRWVLVNPRRFFKYNLNNLTGDLDAVIAGNPRLLRRVGEAGRELAAVMRGKARASARYEEAVARGVFDSGLSVQEIPDINKLAPFERFANKQGPITKVTMLPLRKAWAALQGTTQWRENVFRYAAYLDYVDRIEGGESQASIGYGASRRSMVDAVVDPKDRAALLARDLLGDYGAISHYGGWLRETIIPFWSWMEINTRRYWRLTVNAGAEGIGKGIATGGGLAVAQGARTTAWMVLRMGVVFGLLALWNNLFFPDEEDELGEAQQAQMHLILGRNAEGEIITLRTQGALSDALSWFGLGDVAKAAKDYQLGRGSLADVFTATPKAAVNKIGTSLSPTITVPMEAATGKKLWPDVFNPRANRDPWRNLLSSFSLDNEYDYALGKPSRGYGRSWQEAFIYRRDPGEMAYNQSRGIVYDWLEREKGQTFEGGFSTKRGNAMYDYRTAMRYGDSDAANKALLEMAKLGVDRGDFNAMLKRAAPLGPIPKKDRAAFVNQLTDDERATMIRAQDWYKATFLGR